LRADGLSLASALAIAGGAPAVVDKLPGWPSFDEKAIAAVEQVLRSGKVNYWTARVGILMAMWPIWTR
jgi:hypothetical protein